MSHEFLTQVIQKKVRNFYSRHTDKACKETGNKINVNEKKKGKLFSLCIIDYNHFHVSNKNCIVNICVSLALMTAHIHKFVSKTMRHLPLCRQNCLQYNRHLRCCSCYFQNKFCLSPCTSMPAVLIKIAWTCY